MESTLEARGHWQLQRQNYTYQVPVVQRLNNAFHRVNRYPLYWYLSGRYRYPPFEQPETGLKFRLMLDVAQLCGE